MRKYIGAICSFVTGIATFIFLSIAHFVFSSGMFHESLNAWDMLKEADEFTGIDGYGLYKTATIFLIILAVLAILSGIVMLLQNLGVLKFKFNWNIIHVAILGLYVLFALLALIGMLTIVGKVNAGTSYYHVGVGVYLGLVLGALALGYAIYELVLQKKSN